MAQAVPVLRADVHCVLKTIMGLVGQYQIIISMRYLLVAS
jgi:hypothetical protein